MPRLTRHPPNSPVPSISCREVVELVTAYLEGTLDAATTDRVDAHLLVCDGCQVYVDQIRKAVEEVASADLPPLPEDVCMGLIEAFRGRTEGRESR